MPSYVVVGASRGLGVCDPHLNSVQNHSSNSKQYTFLKVLATNPTNVMIGLVRDVDTVQKRLDEDKLTSVRVFKGDVTNLDQLKVCAYSY